MDENGFWAIVEQVKSRADDYEDRPELLQEQLEGLEPSEIVEFQTHFDNFMAESYNNDLWGAAYLLNGGCSDDGFDYFRAWLISEGVDNFEMALKDPDSLADFAEPDVELESYMYAAAEAYEKKTNKEMPRTDTPPRQLTGSSWDEDDLPEMYPRIADLVE